MFLLRLFFYFFQSIFLDLLFYFSLLLTHIFSEFLSSEEVYIADDSYEYGEHDLPEVVEEGVRTALRALHAELAKGATGAAMASDAAGA